MKKSKLLLIFESKKKNYILLTAILSFWLLILLCPFAQTEQKNSYQSLKNKIDSLAKDRYLVGMIVGIILDEEKYVFPYGSKSLEKTDPPDPNTVFEIGSITKVFTTTILADMVVDGIINLDDPVADYLPVDKVKIPSSNGTKITLKHLATHTSGIPSMPDNIADFKSHPDPPASYTLNLMYDFLNRCSLDFPVGSKHQYSNLGVGLLGHVLAQAEEKSYKELLTDRIFRVLGMNNSSLSLKTNQRKNMAIGYDLDKQVKTMWNGKESLQGSGLIKSNLNDLFKFLEVYMERKETSLKEAITLAKIPVQEAYPGSKICLGWYIDEISDSQQVFNHNGATAGYYAFIGFNRSLDFGAILLTNNMFEKSLDRLGFEILRELSHF